jgi:MFS family permease
LAAVAYLAAGLTLLYYLRPDPLLIAQALAVEEEKVLRKKGTGTALQTKVNRTGVIAGALVLVLSHMIMVAIMTMTPVHMQKHGTGLTAVGLIISLHIAAMYLPSLGTGLLVDKIGRTVMVIASGVTLAISGLMVTFSRGDSFAWLTFALVLLGLGWNFGLISGTAIIIDSTNVSTRARVQGSVDVWIAIGGTAGSVISGFIVTFASYAFLGVLGTYLAVLLIPLIIWSHFKMKQGWNEK